MKNSNIKTINGIGKACSIISKIAFVFCIIGAVCILIAQVAVLAIPLDKINLSGKADATITVDAEDFNISLGNLHLTDSKGGISFGNDDIVSVNTDEDKVELGDYWSLDIEEISSEDSSATYKLTGDFSEFDKKAVKRGLFTDLLEGLFTVAATAVTLFFANKVFKELAKCETPFTESLVKKIKVLGWVMIGYGVVTGLSLTTVVAGLTVLMLGFVFAHGAELQKESDETL